MALKTKNKMEAKEFKEKFKVGDLITSELKGTPLTITAIGENGFMAKDNEGREYVTCFTFNRDWQHYKEPVKNDLEGVEKKESGVKRYSSKCLHINGCNLCRIGRVNIYQCNEYKE